MLAPSESLLALLEAPESEVAPLAPGDLSFLESLKSVSYQPVPLRRKAAADTCFLSAASLHSGQKTNGSS